MRSYHRRSSFVSRAAKYIDGIRVSVPVCTYLSIQELTGYTDVEMEIVMNTFTDPREIDMKHDIILLAEVFEYNVRRMTLLTKRFHWISRKTDDRYPVDFVSVARFLKVIYSRKTIKTLDGNAESNARTPLRDE